MPGFATGRRSELIKFQLLDEVDVLSRVEENQLETILIPSLVVSLPKLCSTLDTIPIRIYIDIKGLFDLPTTPYPVHRLDKVKRRMYSRVGRKH